MLILDAGSYPGGPSSYGAPPPATGRPPPPPQRPPYGRPPSTQGGQQQGPLSGLLGRPGQGGIVGLAQSEF